VPTGAIQTTLRGSAQRTGPSGNVWRYWGYGARRGWAHGGCCRQLLGIELSDKQELAPHEVHRNGTANGENRESTFSRVLTRGESFVSASALVICALSPYGIAVLALA
jgi:hypothetical protein